MKTRKSAKPQDGIRIRGMFRLQIVEGDDGRIVGDSGWVKNLVTNEGKDDYLCRALASAASSKYISRAMLGTGTAPSATDTALHGELSALFTQYSRVTVTNSISASSQVEFQFTFGSSPAHIGSAVTIQNVGLINDTLSGGSMFAGTTFGASQWNTNQSVNGSYRITFQP